MPSENPFVFDRPLRYPPDLLERDEQLAELKEAMRAGSDALVVGPYRHGKTSLIGIALAVVAGEDRSVGVRVDCSGVLTVNDFARRLEVGYAGAFADRRAVEVLVERLDALSFELSAGGGAPTPDDRVRSLLGLAAEVAARIERPAVLCFDEAQDALAIPAVVEAIGQSRDDRVGLVFAGPELDSQDPIAWSKRAPVVSVGRIDVSEFARAIAQRFTETGRDAGDAARALALVGDGHPQRTTLLAAELWDAVGEGQRATIAEARRAIERALVRCTPEFEVRWQALHGNERRVAVAIASGLAPQGTIAQREVGLVGFGAAQRAVRGVEARGVAEAREERMTLTDPLFAEWLRTRYVDVRGPGREWEEAVRGPGRELGSFRREPERERGVERGG